VVTLNVYGNTLSEVKKRNNTEDKGGTKVFGEGYSRLIGDIIKIKLHAAPVGGAANEELIEVLSEVFGIKKRAIKIISGQSSRNKVIEIEGVDTI
jgi:uncharacterized protein (TIGR00251 family)